MHILKITYRMFPLSSVPLMSVVHGTRVDVEHREMSTLNTVANITLLLGINILLYRCIRDM